MIYLEDEDKPGDRRESYPDGTDVELAIIKTKEKMEQHHFIDSDSDAWENEDVSVNWEKDTDVTKEFFISCTDFGRAMNVSDNEGLLNENYAWAIEAWVTRTSHPEYYL